jgi:hypothetical protein
MANGSRRERQETVLDIISTVKDAVLLWQVA